MKLGDPIRRPLPLRIERRLRRAERWGAGVALTLTLVAVVGVLWLVLS